MGPITDRLVFSPGGRDSCFRLTITVLHVEKSNMIIKKKGKNRTASIWLFWWIWAWYLFKPFFQTCNVSFYFFFAILHHQFDNQQEFEGIYESSTTQEGQSANIQKGTFYERVLISINIVFTILFTIECILKLLAFGLKVWLLLFSFFQNTYCMCINL